MRIDDREASLRTSCRPFQTCVGASLLRLSEGKVSCPKFRLDVILLDSLLADAPHIPFIFFLLLTDANRSKSDVHFMRLVADAASPSAKINSHQPADLQGAEENLLAASSEDLTASSSSSSSSLSSSSLSSMARFLTTNGTVVIAQRGSTASLPCEVISLGDGVVSAILQLAPAANL